MLKIDIPGSIRLEISHLVLDYNGTIARDGDLLDGVAEMIQRLDARLTVHVLTADTHGTVREKLGDLPCTIHVIDDGNQEQAKYEYIAGLGVGSVVAVGNGANDRRILKEAALGIGVIQAEGASLKAIQEASVVCTSIRDALNLLIKPARLRATLRK